MSAPYISLSCDSYIRNIFSGFSRLQELQEFVDLTLAADGHLVKVHKNIIALASPYLKAMIQSASSQNPVIYLNNVSYKVLSYLLEYIYQGEVNVPQDTLEAFLQVSQSLHITGMNNTPPKSKQRQENISTEPQVQNPVITSDAIVAESESSNNFAACITINSDHNFEVQQFVENIQVQDEENNCDTNGNNENHNYKPMLDLTKSIQLDKESTDAIKIITQYSVSERGSVQIIVNRYIYSSHHNSNKGRKHRWRCLDYRKLHCPAYIDSWDNRIVSRKGVHNHAFHDNKIYNKHKQNLIFNSKEKAQEARHMPYKHTIIVDEVDFENTIAYSAIPVVPLNQGDNL